MKFEYIFFFTKELGHNPGGNLKVFYFENEHKVEVWQNFYTKVFIMHFVVRSKIQNDGNKYKGCKKEKVFINNDVVMQRTGKRS
jgi:hypothetical protein